MQPKGHDVVPVDEYDPGKHGVGIGVHDVEPVVVVVKPDGH